MDKLIHRNQDVGDRLTPISKNNKTIVLILISKNTKKLVLNFFRK